jgi:hypothetical protein
VESKTISPALAEGARAPALAKRALSRLPLHLLLAACLIAAWLLLAPNSPDLAAQVYRSYLFAHFGMLVWDDNWYGGHHIPGYSLLYPPLAWLFGIRLTGALAVLASTAIFASIANAAFGPRTRLACIWFAVGAAGDLWIGRLTFALGVSFALGAVLVLLRGRGRSSLAAASLLAALSAASSPVAGALLALVAFTDIIANRRLRYGLILIVAVLIVVLPMQALFPEGGFEPYGLESFLPSSAVALAFIWALPSQERLLRIGGWLFLLANMLSLLPTAMGSNTVRYAVLLAGPLLLCAIAREGGFQAARRRSHLALGAVFVGIAFWVVWGPVTQSGEVLKDPSTTVAYYQPLRSFLHAHVKGPARIEVPFTRSHWEAALLAPYVPLARGWERQLDKRYNEAIEADPLSPTVYESWLHENAVGYVALPDVPFDSSSIGEVALIEHGAPFLREVFKSAHWRVYEVLGARPLAEGPGALTQLGHQGFTLHASRPGSFLVKVHYTPYWAVKAGAAKVAEAPGNWTRVRVSRAGAVRVQAEFSLSAALEAITRL